MQHPDFELYDNAGRDAEQIAAARFGIASRDDLLRWAKRDVESFLAGHPLPDESLPTHRSRKHSEQMTAQRRDNQLETAARSHSWQYGRALRSALHCRVPAHG